MSEDSNQRKHHNGKCKWMKNFLEESFGEWNE